MPTSDLDVLKDFERAFVESCIGRRFMRARDPNQVYLCESWDRNGFWMVSETNPADRRSVSESVIGRTFFLAP